MAGVAILLGILAGVFTWRAMRPRRATSEQMAFGFRVHLSLGYKIFMVLFGMGTLGVMAFFFWYKARNWPAQVDPAGMTLRNGRRILWTEIRGIRQVETRLYGAAPIANRWEISDANDVKAVLVPDSLSEGRAVMEFVSRALGRNLTGA